MALQSPSFSSFSLDWVKCSSRNSLNSPFALCWRDLRRWGTRIGLGEGMAAARESSQAKHLVLGRPGCSRGQGQQCCVYFGHCSGPCWGHSLGLMCSFWGCVMFCFHWQFILSPSLPFLLEISSRYARIRQCFYPHDQRHHNQPRPAVDGAAHRHHLHVQPILSLTPIQPPTATAVLSGRTHSPTATGCDQNHRHHSGTETKGWAGNRVGRRMQGSRWRGYRFPIGEMYRQRESPTALSQCHPWGPPMGTAEVCPTLCTSSGVSQDDA